MNIDTPLEINSFCPNSKMEIKANNYNKSKTFNVEDNENSRLSRVDSNNYPEATNNLDNLAQKMGFNHKNNKSSTLKSEATKSDRCSDKKLNEKHLNNSFSLKFNNQVESNTNKPLSKSSIFMSNIIRRLSISTPKIFSKNKKHKRSKLVDVSLESNNDVIAYPESVSLNKSNNNEKLTNGVHSTPKSKNITKVLQRLARRKGKAKIVSEPPSSIDSRPSLSSILNHGTRNFETTTSCNDIYLHKVIKNGDQSGNCSSVDYILDCHKQDLSARRKESASTNSEDLREHEAKLNAATTIPQGLLSDEFPDLEIPTDSHIDQDNLSPLSVKTTDFKFDTQRSCHSTMSRSGHPDNSTNIKLTLALYGYSNYGLGSSRLASKSCMEFRLPAANKAMQLSVENISINQNSLMSKSVDCREKSKCEKESQNDMSVPVKLATIEQHNSNENDVTIRPKESSESDEKPSVVLRKSQRPNDIKLRKSREPSQNMVARSSMIMLVVSHNSPRSKISSANLTTPNKELDLNASLNSAGTHFGPSMKLSFDGSVTKNSVNENSLEKKASGYFEKRTSGNLSTTFEGTKLENENGAAEENHEVPDGNHFLSLVYKHENEILSKIETVQRYLNDQTLQFDDEVSGQLMVTIGKAKLLLSEKMLQFKGLCEKNIRGIIEENELPTLLSDLNGFWDMVFGQIEDINKNFVLVEKIRLNDWKMIPYELEERNQSTTTPARSKRSTISKTSVSSARKTSAPCTPMKKKLSSEQSSASKLSADKRRNMMQFKMNQKASLANSNGNDDITFY